MEKNARERKEDEAAEAAELAEAPSGAAVRTELRRVLSPCESSSLRHLPTGRLDFHHFEANFDSREKAKVLLKAKSHGNQHLAHLLGGILFVWRTICATVQDGPVGCVDGKAADPPKVETYICWLADRCLCSAAGRIILAMRAG